MVRKQNHEKKQAESVSGNFKDEMLLERQLDRKISETLHSMLNDFPVPNGDQAWLLMRRRMFGEPQLIRRRSRRKQLASAVICFILATSLSIGGFVSSANLSDFYRLIKVIGNGALYYVFDHQSELDPGTLHFAGEELDWHGDGNDVEGVVTENTERLMGELNEAVAELTYDPLLPTYVPEGYELTTVKVIPDPLNKGNEMLRLEYENGSDELVYFQQRPMMTEGAYTPFTVYEGAGETEMVQIGDYEGVLLAYLLKGYNLYWSQSGMILNVSGDWTKEEMLQFAQSLK